MRRLLRALVFQLLLAAAIAPAAAGAQAPAALPRPAILVLFVDDSSQQWIRDMSDGIALVAQRLGAKAPVLYFEYLDTVRFDDPDQRPALRRWLQDKYEDRDISLVVTVAPAALEFAAEARDDLWPDAGVLFTSYTVPVPDRVLEHPKSAAISFEWGFDRAVTVMKTVLPGVRRVAVVEGSSDLEITRQARNVEALKQAGVEVLELSDLTVDGTLRSVAHLPGDAAVFIASGQVDADRNVIPTWSLCEMVSSAANRPLFMLGSQFLGCGIVGGLMRDFAKIGAIIGQRAMAVLGGANAGHEHVPFAAISTLAFDARQLERWGIDRALLPPTSDVRFQRVSLWSAYRRTIVAVAAGVALQSALIVVLFYERRRRIRATEENRRNLTLAAHADRRAAVAALTGSMAHELGQPLSAILFNAATARRLVESDRATPEALCEILDDISRDDARAAEILQRQRTMLKKREIEQQPFDVNDVARESLALLEHDAKSRRVRIEPQLSNVPCVVSGDRVLLQQVIVNLVVNAMDAMAHTPPGERRVVVQTAARRHDVEVSVIDCGDGIADDVAGQLFDPFVSTKAKGMGIGLAIVRSIVESHGGRVQARNNAAAGATFWFTLPALGRQSFESDAARVGGRAGEATTETT